MCGRHSALGYTAPRARRSPACVPTSRRALTTPHPPPPTFRHHDATSTGPGLFFKGAFEIVREKRVVLSLKHNEFVKLQDTMTGKIRVVRGECACYVDPMEKALKPLYHAQPFSPQTRVQRAVEIDVENVRGRRAAHTLPCRACAARRVRVVRRMVRLA